MLEQSQASNCPETAQKRFLFRSPEDNVLSLVSPTPNYSNIPSDSTHCVAGRKGGSKISPVFFANRSIVKIVSQIVRIVFAVYTDITYICILYITQSWCMHVCLSINHACTLILTCMITIIHAYAKISYCTVSILGRIHPFNYPYCKLI